MIPADLRATATALGVGIAGAAMAAFAGLPAAALLGSASAVTLVALAGLRVQVPAPLRQAGFAVIGVLLGAGVTPTFLSDIARWPISLLVLTATILAVMALSGLVLGRFFGLDRPTSALATSPGALTYALTLAATGHGDLRAVMVLQSLRLLIITLLLPPIIATLGEEIGGLAPTEPEAPAMGYLAGLVLLALGYALGVASERMRMPAAFLLAGLLVSGLAHAAGLVVGRLPEPLVFLGFTITGAVIGARFAGVSAGDLRRLGIAGVIAAAVAIGIAGLASLAVAGAMDMPFGQVWVAFAPGGVESMAAMALALGYDPVYVATHHVYRIVLLIAILPVILRFLKP